MGFLHWSLVESPMHILEKVPLVFLAFITLGAK